MQQLSPIGWALRPLKNYANFSGRASRAEFWWFFLFMVIAYFVVWIAFAATVGLSLASGSQPSLGVIGALGFVWIFMLLCWLALIIPTIAVQVRRLHDTDRSGWWVGGFYLAYLAYLVLMVGMLSSLRLQPGGPPPDLSASSSFSLISYGGFAFFVYSIALLVFFCLEGTKGANRFGEDPYGPDVEQVFA